MAHGGAKDNTHLSAPNRSFHCGRLGVLPSHSSLVNLSQSLYLFFFSCVMSCAKQEHSFSGPQGSAAHLSQPAQDCQQNKYLTSELTHELAGVATCQRGFQQLGINMGKISLLVTDGALQ